MALLIGPSGANSIMERKPHFTRTGVRHATINGHRFHLRLTDPTEENFLWIDGKSPPLVLDQVAAEFLRSPYRCHVDHAAGSRG